MRKIKTSLVKTTWPLAGTEFRGRLSVRGGQLDNGIGGQISRKDIYSPSLAANKILLGGSV
jgi:hypothetical protein